MTLTKTTPNLHRHRMLVSATLIILPIAVTSFSIWPRPSASRTQQHPMHSRQLSQVLVDSLPDNNRCFEDDVPPIYDEEDNGGDDDDDDDGMDWFRFASIDELYSSENSEGDDTLERLRDSTVAIVGMGGVGSYAAEALCRCGVGRFILVDLEDICVSQTTSGLNSMASNIGIFKTEIMRQRMLDIHPKVQVDIINDFVKKEDNLASLLPENVNVAIDSIDGDEDKIAFWKACHESGIHTITTGSAEGKTDPTKIVCRPLDQVAEDELLVTCRETLNGDGDGKSKLSPKDIHCVYSEQERKKAAFGMSSSGKVCFVTGSFGLTAASKAMELILAGGRQSSNEC